MRDRVTQPETATGVARFVAFALTAVMVIYFLTNDDVFRSDNAFLVPDALLTVFLLGSALARRRWAIPSMIFAFAWAAAVWSVSLATYTVRGEFSEGVNHLALIIPAVAAAGLLLFVVRSRARETADRVTAS